MAAATRAESGMQPAGGDVALLRQRVALEPQLADRGQLPAVPDLVQSGGLAPRVDAWRRLPGVEDGGEFLFGVVQLAVGDEEFDEFLAQFGEDLDVERGVAQPGLRQRAGWTSRRRSVPSRGRSPGAVR